MERRGVGIKSLDKWLVVANKHGACRYGDILNESDWYDSRESALANARLYSDGVVVRFRVDFEGPLKEATAQIITAAPDLLSACHNALKLLRGSGFTENTPTVLELEAAIRKAEGNE